MKIAQQLAPPAQRNLPLQVIGRFWSWLFLLILLIFFSLTGPGFFSLTNFQFIAFNMVLALLMALGQTFVIITAGIDLSTGFVMGFAGVIAAQLMVNFEDKWPLWLVLVVSIGVALIVGSLPGLINGLLIAKLHVPPFIVTLGMYGIAQGIAFVISGGMPISIQANGVGQIGNSYLLYFHPAVGFSFFNPPQLPVTARARDLVSFLPLELIVALVILVICAWLLARTRFGRYTYAIGGGPEAARRAGIPVERHLIKIYVLSAFLTSIAGVLYVLRFTNGAANAGDPLMLNSIAAVVIGGASLFGGEGTIVGALIGTLIIYVIQSGLGILGVNGYWQFAAVGVVIILAVLIDQAKARIVKS